MGDQSESDPAKRQGRQGRGGPLIRSSNRREETLLQDLRRRLNGESRASTPTEQGRAQEETVPLTEAYRRLRCRSEEALLQDLQRILSDERPALQVAAAQGRQGETVTLQISLHWQSLSPAGREAVRAYERQQRPGDSEPGALSDSRQRGSRRGSVR